MTDYFHIAIWLAVAIIHQLKRTQFSGFFLVTAIGASLAFISYKYELRLNNTIYFIEYIVAYFILARVFSSKIGKTKYYCLLIFSLHLYNIHWYKLYELELLWFLFYDTISLLLIESELKKNANRSSFLMVLAFSFLVSIFMQITIFFKQYAVYTYLMYTPDLLAIFYMYAAFNAEKFGIARKTSST